MHACVALGCARTGGNSRELSATYMIRWKTVTYTIRWQKAPSVSVSYYNTVRVSRSGPPVVKRPCSVWSIVISLNPSSTRNCDVVHHPAKSLNPSASRSKVGLIQGCNYSITICEYTFHLKWQSTNHSYIFQMRHSPILLHHHFGLFNNQEDYRTLSVRKTDLQQWPQIPLKCIQRLPSSASSAPPFPEASSVGVPLQPRICVCIISALCSRLLLQCWRPLCLHLLISWSSCAHEPGTIRLSISSFTCIFFLCPPLTL